MKKRTWQEWREDVGKDPILKAFKECPISMTIFLILFLLFAIFFILAPIDFHNKGILLNGLI